MTQSVWEAALPRPSLARFIQSVFALAAFVATPEVASAQILETETARLLAKGAWELTGNLEYQTSSDGRERALPWAIEHGFGKNIELLIEPVLYTSIQPSGVESAHGLGDTEVTLTHLFHAETSSRMPALAWAAEVKLPTGKDPLVGTGEYDCTGYVIASKRIGKFDLHANLSYTWVGAPTGANLENQFGFAIGTVFRPNPRYEVFGEVVGTTAASGSDGEGTGSVVPEAGGETFATVGAGLFFRRGALGFITIGHDNNGANLARIGFSLSF